MTESLGNMHNTQRVVDARGIGGIFIQYLITKGAKVLLIVSDAIYAFTLVLFGMKSFLKGRDFFSL